MEQGAAGRSEATVREESHPPSPARAAAASSPWHGTRSMAAAAMDLPWPPVRTGGRRGGGSKGSAGLADAIAVRQDGGGALERKEGRRIELEVLGARSGRQSVRNEEG